MPRKTPSNQKDPPAKPERALLDLLRKIRAKRSHIATYVGRAEPTANRLTTFATICSVIAAGSTTLLTKVLATPGTTSPSWRWLAVGATISSILAGSANQWYRSRDFAARISKAQAADARLEALETLIEVGQVRLKEATDRYQKCVLEVPFVAFPARRGHGWKREVPLELVEGTISLPTSESHVRDQFTCSGSATGLQPDMHLWLAVEIDGRIWPKEAEVKAKEEDGTWTKTIIEEGTNETFAVSLWVANPEGHKYIRTWLTKSDERGTYPELRRMIRLWRVTELRRTLPSTNPLSSPRNTHVEESTSATEAGERL